MSALKNFILLLVLCTTGCAALVVGGVAAVGTYTYTAGQLKRTYNANLEHTFRASIAGCESLNLPILEQQKKLSKASVKTQDGSQDVWISIRAVTSTTTEISIRVGYLGDEFASRRIHEAIQTKF